MKSIEEEIKKLKFVKSISDKDDKKAKNKDRIILPSITSLHGSYNKRVTRISKFDGTNDDKNSRNENFNKRYSRAQSTSFKFFQMNSTIKRNENNKEVFLKNNLSIINESGKKK